METSEIISFEQQLGLMTQLWLAGMQEKAEGGLGAWGLEPRETPEFI